MSRNEIVAGAARNLTDLHAYVALAVSTLNPAVSNHQDCLANAALGLAGESGEVADLIKKHLFHGRMLIVEKVVEELGDVMWYIALLCDTLDIPMEKVFDTNIKKLQLRHKGGFVAGSVAAGGDTALNAEKGTT